MKTAEDYLKEAERHDRAREESFQRSDTDGFLSQWASGLNAELARAHAELADAGGMAEFPGLFRRSDGVRVRAKLISYYCKFSYSHKYAWSFRDEEGEVDRRKGLLPDTRSKRGKLWRSGYEVRMEWAPAKAGTRGEGTGLSGSVWVVVYRTDDGYPEDAVSV